MGAGCSTPPQRPQGVGNMPGHGRAPERRATSTCMGLASMYSPGRECESREGASRFSFGLCNGVGYADKTASTGWRDRYRHALDKLYFACKHWVMSEEDLSFVLSLGNVTTRNNTQGKSEMDLSRAMKVFDKLARSLPVYHAFGQNEAMVKSVKGLLGRMGLEESYFSRKLPCGWRLVVLDTNQECTPSPTPSGFSTPREAVGVGEIQLKWLQAELDMAKEAGERVIVAAHDPLIEECSLRPEFSIGNSKAVRGILVGHPATALVLCSGSSKHGSQYRKANNVHFLTVPEMVNSPSASIVPHCIIEIQGDGIAVRGYGGLPDRVLRSSPLQRGPTGSRQRRATAM